MPLSSIAVIFDCDGVLVDSERIAIDVLLERLHPYQPDHDFLPDIQRYTGHPSPIVLAKINQQYTLGVTDTFINDTTDCIRAAIYQGMPPIAGVAEVINALPYPTAVASNSQPRHILRAVEACGLVEKMAGRLIAVTDVALPKPAPDIYLEAAKRLGYAANRCVVVEDSLVGVRAGVAAGMTVIGFIGAGHVPLDQADKLKAEGARFIISNMNQLPALLTDLAQTLASISH